MLSTCYGCDKPRAIVNSYFKLCRECNIARLREEKKEKNSEPLFEKKELVMGLFDTWTGTPKSKGLFEKPKVDKAKLSIEADEIFYEVCFNNSDHRCEECNAHLPDIFRDESGKVVARWRYSHIIPKSIAPKFRHHIKNINHLCLECHERWENKDKANMKIFVKNLLLFPQFLNKYLKV